ncbi:hypothetical protein M7I_3535 [Glarea lozoyensis 74030]|uniref:Apple domain-containing protein n=1 Tax=Glarea lozoyensis (strain ATCC 74030 / MF5533) TaxID=1104152 RepID=H0ELR5_GLAL7|nr:hypothetical protein M7I_3535 [Glarea lozoyensis 74030]
MRQSIVLAGFVAVVSASPAAELVRRQNIDFAAVNAAPAPQFVGPPVTATSQNIDYNTAAVTASGAAAATAIASSAAKAAEKRSVEVELTKRTFCFWPFSCGSGGSSEGSTPKPVTTTSKVDSKPTSTTSVPVAIATYDPALECAAQGDGYGPKPDPDTPEAFLAYQPFHDEAQGAKVPSGYTSTFTDLNAAVNANTYLGLITLQSYDVAGCASLCDNKDLCTAFNIYFERDPSVNPAAQCANPPSITNYKCTLWGSGVTKEAAVNDGQYRTDFHVVITGSNGYSKVETTTPVTPPGWQEPTKCGNGHVGHNHPTTCIGTHFYPGPYNPLLCASYAVAQNAINVKANLISTVLSWFGFNPYKVNFFNSYMLKKDGKPLGTYCSIYAQKYSSAQASYDPGFQGGFTWSIESSWSWSIKA